MCATCGCDEDSRSTVTDLDSGRVVTRPGPGHAPDHSHGHDHDHDHEADHGHGAAGPARTATRVVTLEQSVLAKNDLLAGRNRDWLAARFILALNVMSSPGSGKTTLLERTVRDLRAEVPVSVVEGDQETLLDAERIRATGCRVVQINTGSGCHLDAEMLGRGLATLDPPVGSLVLIENVGNLVCPALFDLGERARVVVMSVTEGDDKPLKYPHMFRSAQLMVINKVDLAPHVDFDPDRCAGHARTVNPGLEVLSVSATRGDGLDAWYAWLRGHLAARRP
ncbi:hydrogenase accessory protein HypB [Longispora fulva]|uniref:Hydrogenase nickel incorporation protein HypB n=1 Tax=Longispora fulva TaxID=619741 RepID=A0A8J7GF69_9ACTN|nr:hydrogenase nickel incorporation protein HypB [Longispora fulva]MBG6136780.1 hydrogenase nickel incorporation protein HypB [Longispora fulva]GIG59951.1 hydrogenase accessory protein HypB [Longispora fulva]